MKVILTIELDLPDTTPVVLDSYNESIKQVVFDSYINYITCCHLKDAVKWCSIGKVGSHNEDLTAKGIYQYHDTWANICKNSKWSMDIINA